MSGGEKGHTAVKLDAEMSLLEFGGDATLTTALQDSPGS